MTINWTDHKGIEHELSGTEEQLELYIEAIEELGWKVKVAA